MGVCKKKIYILARDDLCGQTCSDTSDHASCPRITDEQRKELFEGYWGMTWDQRRMYASSMVTSNPAKRKRSYSGVQETTYF